MRLCYASSIATCSSVQAGGEGLPFDARDTVVAHSLHFFLFCRPCHLCLLPPSYRPAAAFHFGWQAAVTPHAKEERRFASVATCDPARRWQITSSSSPEVLDRCCTDSATPTAAPSCCAGGRVSGAGAGSSGIPKSWLTSSCAGEQRSENACLEGALMAQQHCHVALIRGCDAACQTYTPLS